METGSASYFCVAPSDTGDKDANVLRGGLMLDVFLDELEKIAKGEVAVHKDYKKPEVIDVKGRVKDPKQRQQFADAQRKAKRSARFRGAVGAARRTAAGVKSRAGDRMHPAGGALRAAAWGTGIAALSHKKRKQQREYDDLNTGSKKSKKRYTASTATRAAQIGGGLFAANEASRAVGQHFQRSASQSRGANKSPAANKYMSGEIKGSLRRAGAGAAVAVGATVLDRMKEKRRRKKFQEGLGKKAAADVAKPKKAKDDDPFKPNAARAVGRGALTGYARYRVGKALINGPSAPYRSEGANLALNFGNGMIAGRGFNKGVEKSIKNQRKEHAMSKKIKALKERHGVKEEKK